MLEMLEEAGHPWIEMPEHFKHGAGRVFRLYYLFPGVSSVTLLSSGKG